MTTEPARSTLDPVDRAHLTGRSRSSPPIHRYPAAPELRDLVERYWIPVWSLKRPSTQSTLQHPVCLIVVAPDYARFYGTVRGRSKVTLEGDGWAVGAMLRPATGRLLLGRSVAAVADTHLDLPVLDTLDGVELAQEIRAAMAADPHDTGAHATAITAIERRLRPLLPVDDQGRAVNDLVDWLREHPEVTTVTALADRAGMSVRSLERLIVQRTGVTPKWLIQRRRLHDAVVGLKEGTETLASLAARLGYTDQAHFTHDFRTVTHMTPGAYLADQHDPRPSGRTP